MVIFRLGDYEIHVENMDGFPSVTPDGEIFSYRIINTAYHTTEDTALDLPEAVEACIKLDLLMESYKEDYSDNFVEVVVLPTVFSDEVSIN